MKRHVSLRAALSVAVLSMSPYALAAEPAGSPGSAMLVLDASGSMWGQLQGKTKIELAREAVDGMLQQWPADQSLGLIAYGHRRKGDCEDIEVLRPAEGFDAAAIRTQVHGLQPKGMTPISAAVRLAAEQLKFTEHKATVILVSDGEETCNADPCALGAELETLGVDFTAHVIGFDLPEGKAREQLQCLAKNTGGEYFEARNAGELSTALGRVTEAAAPPPPAVKTADAWMPDVQLWPEADTQLQDAGGGTEMVEFSVEQTAQDCQALCAERANCAAWTYEPTGSYFVEYPRCALKSAGFALRIEKTEPGDGWVSGVKPGVKLIATEAQPE